MINYSSHKCSIHAWIEQKTCIGMAREYATTINDESKDEKLSLPVHLENHLIIGLDGLKKMSKSNSSKAIFADDCADVIKEKMKSAACTDDINGNPIFDYIKYLILPWFNSIEIEGQIFNNSKEIEKEFEKFDKTNLKSNVDFISLR